LTASSQSTDSQQLSHDHEQSLAADDHHGLIHESHHGHVSVSKHDRGQQYLAPPQPPVDDNCDGSQDVHGCETPLQANTPHDDAHHNNSAQTLCLLQSAAQHSHLSTSQPVSILFLSVEFEERLDRLPFLLSPFNPSPFSQRAPPTI
jgi:hypothetical protein